ncbi:hypothetical protein K491DRAFT_594374 [Lophiostoma macrostomum CBS 122681]|uniref:Uncharacterized protein n=1 Tax=Lophiostoma macrostomum CBS 122681 TaxID=1314788 RepID=A0A6A6TFE4_9PLEO|nr:hypothetical protein K491DRAFT_594374 [Lophiostoma macrostomum CBS 122681]
MASSSADAHSQPRRPAPMARQSSTSSYVSQSPGDGHHKPAQHKAQRQHVVGQSRMQRNRSFGKNLDKLNRTAAQPPPDSAAAKHHRRNNSGNSISAPNSPRPSFKRNASSGGIVRANHQQQTHAALRKNHSHGHLARQGSSKTALKSSKSEVAPPKKSLANPGKARQDSPDDHPTVHFDIGDVDDGPDDGWTEESASQSPTTTRSNTRSNSIILDPHKAAEMAKEANKMEEPRKLIAQQSAYPHHQILPDRTNTLRNTNGSSSHHHSRPADADMITSRLLQRSSSHNPPPQTSSIAATVVSDHHDARILSQSANSTLVDTPGRDLVSRFMDGDGSAGTPRESFLRSGDSPEDSNNFDNAKRNKSMPNVAGTESPMRAQTPSRTQSRRSGTSTPSDLPPSRTQQKLMLQRASSAIEPQKLIPAILPRAAGPIIPSQAYATNHEGRPDPHILRRYEQVNIEYRVARRYRNPLADAVARVQQIPGVAKSMRSPKSGRANGFKHGVHGSSVNFHETSGEMDGVASRRSRVGFDGGRNGHEDEDIEGRHSFESEHERVRNEAEELCRRLWESTETVDGD